MKHYFTLLLLLTICLSSAQDYKFGKVSIDEVQNNTYTKDATASAVVLYKNRESYFSYEHPDGWIIITEVHKRVKILSNEGLDYATEKIMLYKNKKSKEKVSNIKGFTYTIENGKLSTEKLKKGSIFNKEVSDNYEEEVFTMPNVKVGSVVEWSYKITSPFWKIDDLVIQENIPTEYYLAKIHIPEYFSFKKMVKGGFQINPKDYRNVRNVKVSYEESGSRASRGSAYISNQDRSLTDVTKTRDVEVREMVTEYDLVDIPALKIEPYVNNHDNYRLLVTYELMSVTFPGSPGRNYSTTWDDVIKSINKHDDFGGQLKNSKFLEADAASIKGLGNNQAELAVAAYSHIQNKMNWNGNYGKYCDNGIQKAYRENTGDVSEINLMLVALMRECGLNANPVLISTRRHGIPVFPTLEGFNYVVASAEINGNDILFDATEKNLVPGLLPPRAINWEGTLVKDDDTYKKVHLFPAKASRHDIMLNIEINELGDIKGQRRTNLTDLDAYNYRIRNRGSDETERIEGLADRFDMVEITDYEVKNMNELGKPIVESYSFVMEDAVDVIGDELYIAPLLKLALQENPFKSEDRYYPVDFIYPVSRKKMVTVKIPEGYSVVSIPEPIKLSLPNNLGSFLFNIRKSPTGLSLVTDFKMNVAVVPTQNYKDLKEFYNQRILKETEKIVLKKM